jgi:hypothetical protein
MIEESLAERCAAGDPNDDEDDHSDKDYAEDGLHERRWGLANCGSSLVNA